MRSALLIVLAILCSPSRIWAQGQFHFQFDTNIPNVEREPSTPQQCSATFLPLTRALVADLSARELDLMLSKLPHLTQPKPEKPVLHEDFVTIGGDAAAQKIANLRGLTPVSFPKEVPGSYSESFDAQQWPVREYHYLSYSGSNAEVREFLMEWYSAEDIRFHQKEKSRFVFGTRVKEFWMEINQLRLGKKLLPNARYMLGECAAKPSYSSIPFMAVCMLITDSKGEYQSIEAISLPR